MADYTPEALGKVIKELRKQQKLTQVELGARAGYEGGAGVSISRIESGQMEPSDERFQGLAHQLGVTPDELVARAVAETNALRSTPGGGMDRVEHRIAQIERVKETRQQLVHDVEALGVARDRAADAFLLRFNEIARLLHDAPSPDPVNLTVDDLPRSDDAAAEAALQLEFTKFGVEQALAEVSGRTLRGGTAGEVAFETFTRLVTIGVFPLGSSLTDIGAAAVLKPLQRATGMRAGPGVATGIVSVVGIAATTAAVWLQATITRNRKQQQTLSEAEEAIAQTQPGIEALTELVPKATEILDYIAVHASHALERWGAKVGPAPRDWSTLTASEQKQYFDFVEIAAAQLAVATMKLDDLLKSRADELERDRELSEAVLTQALEVVTSHV